MYKQYKQKIEKHNSCHPSARRLGQGSCDSVRGRTAPSATPGYKTGQDKPQGKPRLLVGWQVGGHAGKHRGAFNRVTLREQRSSLYTVGAGGRQIMDALMNVDSRRQNEDKHLTA